MTDLRALGALGDYKFADVPENARAWWRYDIGVHRHHPDRHLSDRHATCVPLAKRGEGDRRI